MAARLQAIAAAPGGGAAGRCCCAPSSPAATASTQRSTQTVDETTDVLAFLLWQADVPGFALPGDARSP